MLAPVDIARPVPADMLIVPVLDAKPLADRAFSPLIEIVIEPAAVAVCRLIFAPAAKASEIAVPVMLVPEALIVWVPAAAPEAPIIVIDGFVLNCESVILLPATNWNAVDDAVLTVPLDAPPAAVEISTSVE